MINSKIIKDKINIPTEEDAITILENALGKKTKNIRRFPNGLAHYVYDIITEDGINLVVRLARHDLKYFFQGALSWYELLKSKRIPLPKLYYSDIQDIQTFPTMIMERLSGEDLIDVYPKLLPEQKKILAVKIIEIQNIANSLPMGNGYGYARSRNDKSLHKKWIDLLNENLNRSRLRIEKTKIIDTQYIDRVMILVHQNENYFTNIKPLCFLDDIATKNVIIDNGKLNGIVDVDSVAYGDQLLVLGLTKMSLLSNKYDTIYTDYWTKELNLTTQQKKALNIYVVIFCLDFISEIGHQFNKDTTTPISNSKLFRLQEILEQILSKNNFYL
ncbi:hypothetical protein LBMAG33_7460 [Candidatus Levyibacteriota bacterium]|nr:hypothetical protein LBMAG33_7460 [Candidatus Levybacteria bacterium]